MTRLLGLLALCLIPANTFAQTADMCALLARNPSWSDSLKAAQTNWQVNPGTILTIIDQESRFNPMARGQGAVGPNPVRNFGYAQANLQTWNWYLREVGRTSGARSDFALAADFIGWHFAEMEGRIKASRTNFVAQYLAYKLGEGGYKRGGTASARALAGRLAARAKDIDQQLTTCGF